MSNSLSDTWRDGWYFCLEHKPMRGPFRDAKEATNVGAAFVLQPHTRELAQRDKFTIEQYKMGECVTALLLREAEELQRLG